MGTAEGVEPCRYLERHGIEVREADGGDEALAALESTDCVVAAYDLHDGTGVDLLRRVRERSPDRPFLLYTTAGSERVATEAVAADVPAYLPADALSDPTGRLRERTLAVTGERACRARADGSDDGPPEPDDPPTRNSQTPDGRTGWERTGLRARFENIPDPAVEARMADGEPIVERVNPAVEAVFGYDGAELRGEDLDDYIVPDDRAARAARYNERIESGDRFHGADVRLNS